MDQHEMYLPSGNNQLKSFARAGFLWELLSNNIESVKDVWLLQKSLGIETMPNTVMVVSRDNYYTETRNKSDIQKRSLRLETRVALERAAKPFDGLVVHMEENLFAVLFEAENAGDLHVRETLRIGSDIKNAVERATRVSASIGIGRRYKDVHDLHLSYREALAALNHRFFLGGSQVIHIDNVLPYSDEPGLFSLAVESDLAVKVLSCDRKGAEIIIDDLIRSVGDTRPFNPLSVKMRFLEMFASVLKAAFEASKDKESLAAMYGRCVEGILKSDTLLEANEQAKEFVRRMIDEVYSERKRMNLESFEKAVRYIQGNFRRPITLEDVAGQVNLSTFHFSHGFKKFTGMNFTEYLTRLRVEEAKKLLVTTNLSIKEVGRMVGYGDPNYFARVFRLEVGMPPSRFRLPRDEFREAHTG